MKLAAFINRMADWITPIVVKELRQEVKSRVRVSAPFMTFTYLLRGIDIPTILTMLGIDLLLMLVCTMLALFLAALPGGRPVKVFFCFVGFGVLVIACFIMTISLLESLSRGVSW